MTARAARPDLSGHVYTWMDMSRAEVASAVSGRLLSEGDPFLPDRMDHDEPVRQKFEPEGATQLWQKNISTMEGLVYGQLILERKTAPHTGFMMRWQRTPPGLWLNSLGVWADERHFENGTDVERLLNLTVDLFNITWAGYGSVCLSSELEDKFFYVETLPSGLKSERSVGLKAQEGLADLYWANLFGPPYVKAFGRERIESCPGAAVRRIGSDSFLLLTCDSPFDWSRPDVRRRVEEAKRHLGAEYFFDRAHPDRRPKPPDWPPE